MAADADITVLLAAIKSKLAALFPTVPVVVKAMAVTEAGRTPQPGWTVGTTLPCFCVSELAAELIDQSAPAFGFYSVDFPIAIEYVKSGAPQNWADDKDVRDKRQLLIDTFYTGLPGANVPNLPDATWGVRCQPLPVYQANEAGNVVASGVVLVYTTTRNRG